MARTLIGNIKGPKGDTGDTGATGATGAAGASASVSVGTVTALEYGNNPTVTNSGSAQNAVFNFGIPKGKPADNITELDNLPVNSSVTLSADFPVPAVGDTSKTILGKIIKWFGDMSALVATKFNAANVVNNLTTTSSGYALDARQGKALNDTKLNVENVVNNLTTTASGYALDARQGKALNDALENIIPSVIVDEEIRIQNTSKNYTVPYHGLYLMFARTNASANTAQPKLKIEDASGVVAENVGAAGGSVMIHKASIVNANTTVTLTAQDNITASGAYNGYGRFTIILLRKY